MPPSSAAAPCGYWLSPEARTAAQLDQLGLQVLRVAELSPLVADGYTDQGGHIVTQRLLADAIPGSYHVSLNQGHAYLATALLEPDTPYSSYAQGTQLDLSHVLRVVAHRPRWCLRMKNSPRKTPPASQRITAKCHQNDGISALIEISVTRSR